MPDSAGKLGAESGNGTVREGGALTANHADAMATAARFVFQ